MIGLTLRHYRIENKIGEGGMGVVYRAWDTHLDRPVAIKILTPDTLADTDHRMRFVQEAKAASALNHPNIVTIYDIDTAEIDNRPVDYIVMEYIAGKTLDRLIARKGLDVADCLRYAVQIADALTTAHSAGIIHRDIKPANIMVTDQGLVKILDFGLAKLIEAGDRSPLDSTQTIFATPQTEKGTVIGTAAYMSPEQAKGYALDPRSDVFSFGAVLYEMVTGRRAFEGESKISMVTSVVHKEPKPPGEIVKFVPRDLERIIVRCLRKHPEYRFQHMSDLKVALRELKEESETGRLPVTAVAAVQPPPAGKKWQVAAGLLALMLLAAVVVTGWWMKISRTPGTQGPLLTRITSDSGLTTDPAISPDGKLLAYASDRAGEGNLSIWVRQIAGGEPVRLTSDEADNSEPCFSPDGTQIVFRSEREGGGIYIIAALGGEARLLAKYGRNPRFSPDGKWVAFWVGDRQAAAQIYLAPSTGGPPQAMRFRPALPRARYPTWSPDGKQLMFSALSESNQQGKGQYDWWVASVDTHAAHPTGAFAILDRHGLLTSYTLAPGQWIGDRLVFSAGVRAPTQRSSATEHVVNLNDAANLWQIRVAPGGTITDAPERLTSSTGLNAKFSMAATGHVVFSSIAENIDIWSLPMDANQAKVRGGLERLTQDAAPDTYPSITPDGQRMVFWSERSGNADIWLKDLASGRETRLTRDPAYKTYPMIASDRSKVAYLALESGQPPAIHLLRLGPGGEPGLIEKLCSDCGNISDLSTDGRVLYYDDSAGTVASLDIASGRKTALRKERAYYLADPRFSPDGRWVAFHGIVSPVARQIFIAPAPNLAEAGAWVPVTDGTAMDRFAAWSPDGNLLYFISERDGFRCVSACRLHPVTKQPLGPVFNVYHFHSARRSMTSFVNANMARLSVARNRIVFTLGERTGNLWMMKLP